MARIRKEIPTKNNAEIELLDQFKAQYDSATYLRFGEREQQQQKANRVFSNVLSIVYVL